MRKKFHNNKNWRGTLKINQDRKLLKEIEEAKADIKAGRLFSYKKIRKILMGKKARKNDVDK